MSTDATSNTGNTDTLVTNRSQIPRQRRRHLRQEAEYRMAVAKQGHHIVKGYHDNPKGPSRIGAKQLAKQQKRLQPTP